MGTCNFYPRWQIVPQVPNAIQKKNVVTVVLFYADQPGYIRRLRASPYEEFSVRRTRAEFE